MRSLTLVLVAALALAGVVLAPVRCEPGTVVGRAWLPGKPGRVERWWVIVRTADGSVTTVEVGRERWWENGTPVRVRQVKVMGTTFLAGVGR